MRRLLFLSLLVFLALFACAQAEEMLSFVYAPQVVHPGKAERITLRIPQGCSLTLEVLSSDGVPMHTLRREESAAAGEYTVTFNGIAPQGPLESGEYTLRALADGAAVTQSFSVGSPAPQITGAQVRGALSGGAVTLTLDIAPSTGGALSGLLIAPDGSAQPVFSGPVHADTRQLKQEGVLLSSSGVYTLALTLTDENGISSNSYQITAELTAPATPKPQPTLRPSKEAEQTLAGDYWSMELGKYDWQAIWQVMTSPMTVIRGSGKQAERQTYKLRAAPDASTASGNVVGLITCETQGVHVLDTLESGWTLVEAYNSSYGEAYRKAGKGAGYGVTDELISGYVETSLLSTFAPRTDYGLLIDKKTQELYILTEKGLLGTLLISTGYATSAQPWNETPAGEFYLSSKVGDFPSGNLICGYGMRFNNGDILHEVPYIYNEKYDIRDYSSTERYLGEKASHGCVRVQRKASEEGLNMKWIWENVPLRTKLLIWDDDGRPDPYMEYPLAADAVLYYNPNGGQYYHADQNCYSIKSRYLPLQGSVTYAQLDDPDYARLKPCTHCHPPELKMSQVDDLNAQNGY